MKRVVVYTSNFCWYCRQAKQFLKKKGVTYEEVNLQCKPKLREEVIQRSGRRTVPQVFIDDQPVGGFDDLKALDAEGKLDQLLGIA